MSHSIYNADRGTHLKIVAVSLACATMVAAVGIFSHLGSAAALGSAPLVKAEQPTLLSGRLPAVRHSPI